MCKDKCFYGSRVPRGLFVTSTHQGNSQDLLRKKWYTVPRFFYINQLGEQKSLPRFWTGSQNTKVRKKLQLFLFSVAFALSFSSCATIIGGAKYNAKVQVPNHPNANITVNGQYEGQGEANFLVKRIDADKLAITVQEDNCEPETTLFTRKSFRGWACIGSIVGWTGVIPNTYIPLPWGVAVDAGTGAWWKPDINETGVKKIDYDHFLYTINYKAIPKSDNINNQINTPKEKTINEKSKADKLRELKQLLDDGILTQEEFNNEKAKLLESE